MKTKLIFFKWTEDDDIKREIISDAKLIRYVDEMDFTDMIILAIYDITEPINIYPIHYVGWQRGCLIEFADEKGNIVLSGYGTNH